MPQVARKLADSRPEVAVDSLRLVSRSGQRHRRSGDGGRGRNECTDGGSGHRRLQLADRRRKKPHRREAREWMMFDRQATAIRARELRLIIDRPRSHELVLIRSRTMRGWPRLMANWQDGGFPANPRRDAILAAARVHDDGWIEEDDGADGGRRRTPVDSSPHRRGEAARLAARRSEPARAERPYVAALVAQHALTVYDHSRRSRHGTAFFARMAALACPPARCGATRRSRPGSTTGLPIRPDGGSAVARSFCNGWRQSARVRRPSHRPCTETALTMCAGPVSGGGDRSACEAGASAAARTCADAALRAAFAAAADEWVRRHGGGMV